MVSRIHQAVVIVTLFAFCGSDTSDKDEVDEEVNICGGIGGRNSSVEVADFKVDTVDEQFIVQFRGWYGQTARHSYIKASLGDRFKYKILDRNNPMAGLPTDFDVVEMIGNTEEAFRAL